MVILVSAIKRACRDLARPCPMVKAIPEKKPARRSAADKEDGEDKRRGVSSRIQSLVDAVKHKSEPEKELPPSLDTLSEGLWATWCRKINVSRLDRFPLGFYAKSLRNLPSRLWEVRISTYSKRSFAEVRAFSGHRENSLHALLTVVKIISDLAHTLDRLPEESHSRVLIIPSAILDVSTWISQVLQRGCVPQVSSIVHGFIRPLLTQLDIDLGPQVAEMVERRIGVDGPPQTLDEIGHDFRVTRERIRQQTKRAIPILRNSLAGGQVSA